MKNRVADPEIGFLKSRYLSHMTAQRLCRQRER